MSRRQTKKIQHLTGAVIGVFVLTIGTQGYRQVVARDATLRKAKESQRFIVERPEFARRGSILSSDGTVLAQSADSFELALSYGKTPQSSAFFLALAEASGLSATELAEPCLQGSKSKRWRIPITLERARAIQEVKTEWRADGISLHRMPYRSYPLADAFRAVVGEVKVEGEPTGLEASQTEVLAGEDGNRVGMVDRKGAFLPMRMSDEDRRAVHGKDMTLTLDSGLQVAATSALRNAVVQHHADQGVAVVMHPDTGDLLALATWQRDQEKLPFMGFNPAVMARFEPGSTFKILTLAAAMDKGVVSPNSVVNCGGSLGLGNGLAIHCSHGGHGSVDPREAIAKSCNVSAAIWAAKIGRDDMFAFLDDSGLLNAPGVGMPGERPGLVNRNDGNKRFQLANLGFGQAININPVSLTATFNALASHGMYRPARLVHAVGDQAQPLSAPKQVFTRETADTLLRFMISTFEDESGTAHRLRIPGYELGGKTGTAQKLDARAKDGKRRYVSNFVGYVPGDKPVATILVMIDNPQGGQYYGASVAGPVFREIAQSVIKRFNLPRTR